MAELIRIEDNDGILRIIGESDRNYAGEVRQAIADIADVIEDRASEEAPLGESGELKANPTERSDSVGFTTKGAFLFGGGLAVRGASGFVKGRGSVAGSIGQHIEITVAEDPEHAIWVHQGTGIFGPHATPIIPIYAKNLKFTIDGRKFAMPSVLGQPAQPFLTRAFEFVNDEYVAIRVADLRIEVASLFR